MSRRFYPAHRLAFLQVALALLVQFAPTIHALTPHRHDSATCQHGKAPLHVEADLSAAGEVPCLVCEHLLGRQALADSVGLQVRIDRVAFATLPSLIAAPVKLAQETPENRGPPPPL